MMKEEYKGFVILLLIIVSVYVLLRKSTYDDANMELLNKTTNLLKNNGITSWLDCGTLLGAIRNNDFIKHDTDIDISTFEDNYENILDLVNNDDLLASYGLRCTRKKGKKGGCHEKIISLKLLNKTSELDYIDIYFWLWTPKLQPIRF